MIITKVDAAGVVITAAKHVWNNDWKPRATFVQKFQTYLTLLSTELMQQCFQVSLQMVNTHFWVSNYNGYIDKNVFKLFLTNTDVWTRFIWT